MVIDIAIPFHGNVDYFKETVLSVCGQTFTTWRLFIINDAHPDYGVDAWIEDLKESRIHYFRNANNLGPSLNYMKCLDLIESEYCMILGADDVLELNFLQRMCFSIENNPGHAIYHPYVKVIDKDGNKITTLVDSMKWMLVPEKGKTSKISLEESFGRLMVGNWMYFPSIVWRSKSIKEHGFRKDLNVCQDIWLICELFLSGNSALVIPEYLFNYRRFAGSDSSIKLMTGARFNEEKAVHDEVAMRLSALGKKRLASIAHLHPFSRLHALLLIAKAVILRKPVKPLLLHAFC